MPIPGVLSLFIFFGLFFLSIPIQAAERILSFDSHIIVNSDASVAVTENIKVRVEGKEIRRGIYRALPMGYILDDCRERAVRGVAPAGNYSTGF